MEDSYQYDVVIVGAGPAGLSAARTTARLGFSTLVVERAKAAGETTHPCSAIVAPMPGFVKGRRLLGDLFYPQLDLLIPLSLVLGYPRTHRFVSPGGYEVETPLSRADGSPVAAIDRAGLLSMMAEQAEGAGADFRFGTEALGLLSEEGRICGVKTSQGDVQARVVLAAEGVSRRLSRLAGLFASNEQGRHALILNREVYAPAVGRTCLGQITTFGRRYSSAREGFGTVVLPAQGRASVYFTLLSDGPHHHTEHSAEYYLDEYMQEDPRVRDLLAGAQTIQQTATTVAIYKAPGRVARAGFLSLGDAATPAGHVGILGAMWLGRRAALVTAEALDLDDVSGERLSMYGHLYHNRVLRVLRTEQNLMLGLAEMRDVELDRLAQVMSGLPLSAPFFAGWQGIPWEAARWLAQNYPKATYETSLLQRVLDSHAEELDRPIGLPSGMWPMRASTNTPLS